MFGLLVGIQVLLIIVLLVSRHIPEGGNFLQQTRLTPLLFDLAERVLPLLPDTFGRFFEGRLPDPEELLEAIDRRLTR